MAEEASALAGMAAAAPTAPLVPGPQAAAALPTVPVAHLAPLAIAIATDPGTGALDVALSPDELGPLHLNVATEGDMLRIALTVERPETLDLLRRHADQLLADLRQAGFGHATLSFGQGGPGQNAADRGPANAPPPGEGQMPPAETAPPAPRSAFTRGQGTDHAPLDLRL
ncbi:MAG: flagellar hook-length control protein FliK [Gemmobacter sp.]